MEEGYLELAPELLAEGQAAWERFGSALKESGLALSQQIPALQIAFAFSPFVARACARHPKMARELFVSGDIEAPYTADDYICRLETLLAEAPPLSVGQEAWTAWLQACLRRFRRREMVRIACRDLAGLSDYHETVRDLSALADACIVVAVDRLHALLALSHGHPRWPDPPLGASQADGVQRLVVLGMGKLGARELNFSSDIDLIFAYPSMGNTTGEQRPLTNEGFFTRLARLLIKVLGPPRPTASSFGSTHACVLSATAVPW